jgi:hypothetical protein
MNKEEYCCIGFDWSDEVPVLMLRAKGHGESKRTILKKGMEFCWQVTDGTECIGRFDHDTHGYICSRTSYETHQSGLCYKCFGEAFYKLQAFEALDGADEERLEKIPHIVYLNIFGDEMVKVGVASATRKRTRVLEQGAHASLIIAECGGYSARAIEHLVSSNLDVVDRVQSSQKYKIMHKYSKKQEAREMLEAYAKKIPGLIPEYLLGGLLSKPEFFYNMGQYVFDRVVDFANFYAATKVAVGDIYTGKIEAVVGAHIYYRHAGRLYVVDTGKLRGRCLLVGDTVKENSIADIKKYTSKVETPQMSLF